MNFLSTKLLITTCIFLTTIFSCGQSALDKERELFKFDPAQENGLKVLSETNEDGVFIEDITFELPKGTFTQGEDYPVRAYIIRPEAKGSYAGIVYAHGYGPGWGNRDQFYKEAKTLAKKGVVSILPAGVFPWAKSFAGEADKDKKSIAAQVAALVRCVDILIDRQGVDTGRLTLVGHDYGAMSGAVLSAVDKRVKFYVLLCGDATWANWYLQYFGKAKDPAKYISDMKIIDPPTYLAETYGSEFLLQFGSIDPFVTKESYEETVAAVKAIKTVKIYEKERHTLNDQAVVDRVAWLTQKIVK